MKFYASLRTFIIEEAYQMPILEYLKNMRLKNTNIISLDPNELDDICHCIKLIFEMQQDASSNKEYSLYSYVSQNKSNTINTLNIITSHSNESTKLMINVIPSPNDGVRNVTFTKEEDTKESSYHYLKTMITDHRNGLDSERSKGEMTNITKFKTIACPEFNLIEKFRLKKKPIQKIKGDLNPLDDINDDLEVVGKTSFRRESIFLRYFQKEDKKACQERYPTPDKSSSKDNEVLRESLKRCHSDKKLILSQVILIPEKQYKIVTDDSSYVRLPNNFTTDDHDLKVLTDIFNDQDPEKWKSIINETNIQIYKKTIKDVPQIMIKTYATIHGYTKDQIFEAIANVSIRRQWDTIFSEFKIVENNQKENYEVLYMLIKSGFFLIANRDLVQKRKVWTNFPDDNSVMMHFKSIQHIDCPEKKGVVRAETIISGYFIRDCIDNPNVTEICCLSQTDIKGSIPVSIVNQASKKAPKDWIINLKKGCEIVRKLNIK